jgi:phenylpropionate dioxygenase-like ring-hydroxylating dioxygenase large terminal subunit
MRLEILDPQQIDHDAGFTVDDAREADLDRCGALKDFWYVACLARELPRDRPIARTIFGRSVVLWRDEHGAPRAALDRCLHRATALSRGVVIDGKLCCPYHGWTYDGAGACVHVPSCGGPPDGDVGRLATFPTLEQDGLVYVLPGGDVARARRPAFRVPHVGEPGWRSYFMVTRFRAGVTWLVENFMDVPHTAFVHRGWFRTAKARRVPATVERAGGSVLVTYHQELDRISGLGIVLSPRGEPMTHTDRYVVPNVTRVDYGFGPQSGFVINSQCTPIGPRESLVYTAIAFKLPYGAASRVVGKAMQPLLRWYTKRVILQDVDVMDAQTAGLTASPKTPTLAHTEADALHQDVEAYRAWLRDGGIGDGPPDRRREMVFRV